MEKVPQDMAMVRMMVFSSFWIKTFDFALWALCDLKSGAIIPNLYRVAIKLEYSLRLKERLINSNNCSNRHVLRTDVTF